MLLFSGIHHHQPPRKPWLFERGLGLTRKITKIAKRRAAWIEGVCDAGMVVCAPPPPNLTPQPGSSRGAAGSTPPPYRLGRGAQGVSHGRSWMGPRLAGGDDPTGPCGWAPSSPGTCPGGSVGAGGWEQTARCPSSSGAPSVMGTLTRATDGASLSTR